MTTGLSRVKSLRSLDRNLLQLPDLSDQLLLPRLFSHHFIMHSLRCLLHFFAYLVSDLSVLNYFSLLSFGYLMKLALNLLHDFFSLLELLLILGLALFKLFMHLFLNFRSKSMVFFCLLLLGLNSLFTAEFHFNFLFYDVLGAFDVIFLLHLPLPSVELASVLETHLHLRKFLGCLAVFLVDKMLLSF